MTRMAVEPKDRHRLTLLQRFDQLAKVIRLWSQSGATVRSGDDGQPSVSGRHSKTTNPIVDSLIPTINLDESAPLQSISLCHAIQRLNLRWMVDHHLEDASFPCHRLVERYQAGNRRWTGWEGEKDLGWIHHEKGQVRSAISRNKAAHHTHMSDSPIIQHSILNQTPTLGNRADHQLSLTLLQPLTEL
jgi:hypothetical protein